MKKTTVLIIDDERASREEIKRALQEHSDFTVMGEADNADDAKQLIESRQPDLIFLDIQMPEKTGFDLLESLDHTPAVIFTTAYNQYATQAFEVNALDYLLKPIRKERFEKAIEKIRSSISPMNRKIFIKDGERCFFIQINEIYLIESLDNYTRLYFQNHKALQRRSLRQWEEILDDTIFFRINRHEIVNITYIREINKTTAGRLTIQLHAGKTVEVSNRQSARFINLTRF